MVIAVVADEIGDRRAGDRGGEDVGVRRQERRVEAAPRVADDADVRGVGDAHRDDLLDRGRTHSTTDSPGSRGRNDDVGLQDGVAPVT